MSGILKYKYEKSKNENFRIRDFISDSIKELVYSIVIIPAWYWVSNNIKADLYEPISGLIHYLVLLGYIKFVKRQEEELGSIGFFTSISILILTIILCNPKSNF
ncbi:MAG: hypothetical protein GX265_04560 [Mollicutes bacterium]|nr:hypothetical protein [Mollicutes bacterium]